VIHRLHHRCRDPDRCDLLSKAAEPFSRKQGYLFDKDELADSLNEMDLASAFTDVELDDASLEALLGSGGAVGQRGQATC
tara:strand:- start:1372 stop:1611 length:240 start_codon:yes stop_codon:yes gene_type:complete